MPEQQPPDIKLPDPVEISKSMARIAERSQKLVADFLARQEPQGNGPAAMDPLNIGAAFMALMPVGLKVVLVDWIGMVPVTAKHIEFILVGSLIIFFLIKEPHGLARMWQITKEKLRLWPFPY